MKPNKYRAKSADGFGSKLESAVYGQLVLRERMGEISDIKRQQTVVLQEGKRNTRITWRIDFSFIEKHTGTIAYCEAKGFSTRDYVLKLKLYRANPPAPLEIWMGDYRRPVMRERIEVNK